MRLDIVSWCALIFLGGTCLVSGSSTGARSSTDSGSSLEKSIGSWKRDPFVHEAPLILAASCQDGVVVLAAHTRDDQEPLLYKALDQQGDAKDDGSFTDLPRNYQGPFRINTVDQYGTVLVSTGWRADCDAFLRNAKALAQKESMQFGPPPSTALSSGYGDLLARRLSLYLAQCAVSERVRALSCVSLLVRPDSDTGRVWLVDSSGSYRVRALCVAGGSCAGSTKPVADAINQRLLAKDFAKANLEDTLVELLGIVKDSLSSSTKQHSSVLPLEAAFVSKKNPGAKLRRTAIGPLSSAKQAS